MNSDLTPIFLLKDYYYSPMTGSAVRRKASQIPLSISVNKRLWVLPNFKMNLKKRENTIKNSYI